MNVRRERRHNERAIAMVATMALFVILTAMIAVMLRHNASTRMHLKYKRDCMLALCFAESGVARAVHALASNPGDIDHLMGAEGRGKFEVSWQEIEGMSGVYDIVSTGSVGPPERLARRRICVRVAFAEPDSLPPRSVRVLAWTPE